MPLSYEPSDTNITCHYANGVKLVLDFIKDPFGNRGPNWITALGTCPVRFVGDDGWIETGDSGKLKVHPDALEKDVPPAVQKVQGLDVSAHARNFFDCVKSRKPTAANANIMRNSHVACHAAALSWILKRKLEIDPAAQSFVTDDEANGLRSRPERDLDNSEGANVRHS